MKPANYPKMTALCATFPSLRGQPGAEPFDAEALHSWVTTSGARTSGNAAAVAFVLSVFNEDAWQERMRFRVGDALGVWDLAHRQAFLAWASDPWWP